MAADPRFSVSLTTQLDTPTAVERELGPFRMAILGDFSGRAGTSSGAPAVAGRRGWRVDRDDLDAAIAGIRPALRLRLMPELDPVVISFACIDDFHPDALVDRVSLFRQLRGLEAAPPPAEPRRDLPSAADARATAASLSGAGGGSLLDQIIGVQSPEPAESSAPRPRDDLSAFIDHAVRRHLVREPSAEERDLTKQTDELLAAALRVLLHHPAFQAVESLWRAVELAVRRIETGEAAEIYLFDVTKDEVADDAAGIEKMLLASGRAWSLLTAAHTYGPDDARTLASLAALGRRLGAPCLAGASPAFAGVESFAQSPDEDEWTFASSDAFHELRASSDAASLALVLPRFLARESYGAKAIVCDRIAFEEFPTGERDHASLLWANGAILCMLAIGSRVADGDPPPTRATIDGLPLEIATVDGEAVAVPCAEGSLGQSEVERLLDQGLTPLAPMRDSATVIIPRIQSVAQPPRPLPIRTPLSA